MKGKKGDLCQQIKREGKNEARWKNKIRWKRLKEKEKEKLSR